MVKVVKADSVNERGSRNVLDGDLAILRGFDFNINGLAKWEAALRVTSVPGSA